MVAFRRKINIDQAPHLICRICRDPQDCRGRRSIDPYMVFRIAELFGHVYTIRCIPRFPRPYTGPACPRSAVSGGAAERINASVCDAAGIKTNLVAVHVHISHVCTVAFQINL